MYKRMKEGMKFKTCREISEFLGQKYHASGKGRQRQIAEWKRHFVYSKQGKEWVIESVFTIPKTKTDLRTTNSGGSVYADDLQKLVLMLAKELGDGISLVLPQSTLFNKLSMVNDNYVTGRKYKIGLSEFIEVEEDVVSEFYHSTQNNLKGILETALNKLEKRSLVRWKRVRMLHRHDGSHRVATKEEDSCILKMEREVMRLFDCENEMEVMQRGIAQTFYNHVVHDLNNTYNMNIDNYYKAYEIVYSDYCVTDELGVVTQQEKEEIITRLNNNIQTNLLKNASNRKSRAKSKVRDMEDEGVTTYAEEVRLKEGFVKGTKKLIANTIDNRCEDNSKVIITRYYDEIKKRSEEKILNNSK